MQPLYVAFECIFECGNFLVSVPPFRMREQATLLSHVRLAYRFTHVFLNEEKC